ncbi:hypothetical protein LSTR_LSTR011786 [Laodelphax striatellus]|uniref:Uncharacterized protein n=1 Tax=Laodelphax striatellus TaxID=195883 RepID=A0A482XKT9_LAOST|nr:hypothetical protein LSTR_LSTR011786 [Laodelphax striatellus]
MVYDVNLIATLLLGWTAMCQGKLMETADEPKSVIKEYKAGNLNEKLTIDHVTYDNPRGAATKKKNGDREEGRSVTLNEDDDDDDDDDSPPTTMLTEPSSLKPIGMKRLSPTSRTADPEPTIPEDLLKEVSLMKIPQYDLPKTITSIKTKPLKSFSSQDDFPNYENDDIMKPEYSKYFNDDYQVPIEYQKFNFKAQPVKDDDSGKHVKIEIGKTKVKTVVDEPIIITKTKLIDYNTLENEGDKNSDVYKSFYGGFHDHYRNIQKDKVRSGCYNCYRPLYNPYKRVPYPPPPIPIPPRPHYPLGSPYVPRYANRYARSRYVRPVYRPKPAYVVRGYPPPRHLHYRPPPYRRPRPGYLPRPPLHHPYWYPPPPIPRIPPPPLAPPKPSCAPSKVVKEVHVHHFPKVEKIPVPLAFLEANHDENYEHDTIIEPGPYDEEELDGDEHAELQEINAHLDEALRNNKKELDKNLEDGQRYIIEQEDSGSGNTEEDEYKKPNYNKILDQALVKNRKELEKNLKDGPDIVKTAYLPDDGIYNLHKFADKNHLYNFPVKKAKAKGQKASSSSNANDYKLHLESLKDFEPRKIKILQDGTPIRYILTNKLSYNHTKPQEV